MSYQQISTALLEDLVNRILRLDQMMLDRLGSMDGKIICLQLLPRDQAPVTIYALPFAGGLRLKDSCDQQADVTLKGNMPFFINLLIPGSESSEQAQAKVEIEGDMDLGQRFKETLAGVRVDWEEHISHYLGDELAHFAGESLRSFLSWQRYARERFAKNIKEYRKDELGISPETDKATDLTGCLEKLGSALGRLRRRSENTRNF